MKSPPRLVEPGSDATDEERELLRRIRPLRADPAARKRVAKRIEQSLDAGAPSDRGDQKASGSDEDA